MIIEAYMNTVKVMQGSPTQKDPVVRSWMLEAIYEFLKLKQESAMSDRIKELLAGLFQLVFLTL